jgi:hypothetical protein
MVYHSIFYVAMKTTFESVFGKSSLIL